MAADHFREGFLCSICKRDLKSLPQLQDHFDNAHREDKAVFHHLLGFFGRAKRKLLGDTGAGEAADSSRIRTGSTTSLGEGGIDPAMWEPQGEGACRSHWELFKTTRDRCVNQLAIETNKILIRLERFVTERRSRSKKDHEIVDWMPDSEAKFCWECHKPFGMSRRKHHCRLTGEVICGKCSEFFPLQMAAQVLQPTVVGSERERKLSPSGDKDEDEIRVSHSCYQLLQRKQRETKAQESKPVLVQLYDRMKTFMDEADALLPRYRSLADALNSGDETSSLDIAQGMRTRLIKLHETIDLISKRIMAIGVQSEDPVSPKQIRLQKSVRQFASGYLQGNMIAMVPLPSPKQLQQLQEEKKRAQAERTRREREEAQRAAERVKQMQLQQRREQISTSPVRLSDVQRTSDEADTHHRSNSDNPRRSRALSGSGWQPTVNPNLDNDLETKDPLEIQKDMLINYIEQAKAAGRLDELAALREALDDIEYQLEGKMW